ncbi:MAG: hypothetical protein MJ079_02895 [Ruminococcus sp.]|nr:hypothetical protein [Ruminococcus sp.]
MTNVEKLVALFRKITRIKEDYDGQSFEFAVGLKLAEMMKNDEKVLAAVTGDAIEASDGGFDMQLVIAPKSDGNYFMIFPNTETADDMGTGYTMCSIAELVELVSNTPQMRGIQLILSVDKTTGHFGSGEINANMIQIAMNASRQL